MRARLRGECASIVLPRIQAIGRWSTVRAGGRLTAPGRRGAIIGTRRRRVGDPQDKLNAPILYGGREELGRCPNRRWNGRCTERRRTVLAFGLLDRDSRAVEGEFGAVWPFLENANGRKHGRGSVVARNEVDPGLS